MLRFKDQTPFDLKTNIVYIFKCRHCDGKYMGEDTHHFHTRFVDHMAVSFRTGSLSSQPPDSRFREHTEENNNELVTTKLAF